MSTSEVPLVSVITIFKDAAPFLEEAVDSVLGQTLSRIELLLIDDGGADGSDRIADAVAGRHPERVHVLRHPGRANRGMSASRALGIDHSRGELIAFLDGDDVWGPEHLQREVRLLQSAPEARMSVGRALTWYSWADPSLPDFLTDLPAAPGVVVEPPGLLTAVLRNGGTRTPTCSLLVEANALRASGGPVHEFTGMYEDQVLMARLQVRYPAVVSGGTTARYRQHPASATATGQREGSYHSARSNPSSERFVAWLRAQPELAPERVGRDLADLLQPRPRRRPGVSARARAAAHGAARRLPTGARRTLRELARPSRLGSVRLGTLAATALVAQLIRHDEGETVIEHLTDSFVARWRNDLRGQVLEIGGMGVVARLGDERVRNVDTVDLDDLPSVRSGAADCVVVCDVLRTADDIDETVEAVYRILAPGGTLLVVASAVPRGDATEPPVWLATVAGMVRALSGPFPADDVTVRPRGDVLTAVAVMHGLRTSEVTRARLETRGARCPAAVAARALKRIDRSPG